MMCICFVAVLQTEEALHVQGVKSTLVDILEIHNLDLTEIQCDTYIHGSPAAPYLSAGYQLLSTIGTVSQREAESGNRGKVAFVRLADGEVGAFQSGPSHACKCDAWYNQVTCFFTDEHSPGILVLFCSGRGSQNELPGLQYA
jgi:hypothetical protein